MYSWGRDCLMQNTGHGTHEVTIMNTKIKFKSTSVRADIIQRLDIASLFSAIHFLLTFNISVLIALGAFVMHA